MTSDSRPARPQTILTVQETEWINPHTVRLIAGGPGYAAFQDKDATDKYVKIYFTRPELGLEPPYDMAALREVLPPEDLPTTRTYTVRWSDPAAQRLAIDFVVHGNEGLAGPWAVSATPGDRLVFGDPGGQYAPDPAAERHLFVGDDSAVPAIAAALEALPADAQGDVLLEVDGPEDCISLVKPEGLRVQWLYRDGAVPGTQPLLPEAVSRLEWQAEGTQIFAHGERGAMKSLRSIFKERGVTRDQLSLSAYWALGRDELRFQAEKREPVGVIAPV
ncbi:siderophore-interacting protein [Arthrobacter castelli]|uniref:siderophore-interacting protein n=1 Tax=Arthrobacter castelli TaxID=271431 RepID=UPI0004048D80|nr:siderophore-interacting protein [Arthrobacter castelli]